MPLRKARIALEILRGVAKTLRRAGLFCNIILVHQSPIFLAVWWQGCMLLKNGVCNVTPDRLVKQQLTARLKRLRARIATLTAEAEMIERMVADAEKFSTIPRLKLRANSQGKWTVRGQVRTYLTNNPTPTKAQTIFDILKRYDPSLNASTFRSHLRRMVADGIIKQEGDRGHYQLAPPRALDPEKMEASRPRRRIVIRRDR